MEHLSSWALGKSQACPRIKMALLDTLSNFVYLFEFSYYFNLRRHSEEGITFIVSAV